jgi:hypothetical protein
MHPFCFDTLPPRLVLLLIIMVESNETSSTVLATLFIFNVSKFKHPPRLDIPYDYLLSLTKLVSTVKTPKPSPTVVYVSQYLNNLI